MGKKSRKKRILMLVTERQLRFLTDTLKLKRKSKTKSVKSNLPLNLEQITKEVLKSDLTNY